MKRYTNKHDKISFPIGGIGTGNFAIKSNGALGSFSIKHKPDVYNDPAVFGCINLKKENNHLKVLTAPPSESEQYYKNEFCVGLPDSYIGIPCFERSSFSTKFPFAKVRLSEKGYPLTVNILAWSPFTPSDEEQSSLPFGVLEYQLKNLTEDNQSGVFYFNAFNFLTDKQNSRVTKNGKGFVLESKKDKYKSACFSVFTDQQNTKVNTAFFRGGWYDAKSMLVNDMLNCVNQDKEYRNGEDNSTGGSLSIAFELKPKESKTFKVFLAWFVPYSDLRYGKDENICQDSDPNSYYRPYYSNKFKDIYEVCSYALKNYDLLKKRSKKFSIAFFSCSLPDMVKQAIEANLCILKSPTILREFDGKLWGWEGCGNYGGSCYGSCTHVWNYAQSIPHLFSNLERGLRESDYLYSLAENGHQLFRTALPIRKSVHDFYSAADGQLGGIMKLYREFIISGDLDFLKKFYPYAIKSINYCMNEWDPNRLGGIFEPHHNTYDIEFWGAEPMCTGYYLGALTAMVEMGKTLGEDVSEFLRLKEKCKTLIENELFKGDYFIQGNCFKNVKAQKPKVGSISLDSVITADAEELFEKEGPKYQYKTGCLSDALVGIWLAWACGLDTGLDENKILSHLNSVYKFNLKKDFKNHVNPQRPGYVFRNEGGLLLCSWPYGGKPSLPFIYSDEVWTGIEYQVASFLIRSGEIQKGIDIIQTLRERYNGYNRNPYDEIECGHWYARAMSSYSLIQAYSGIRYNAYDKTLHYKPTNKKTVWFFAWKDGYANITIDGEKISISNVEGTLQVNNFVVE